MLLSALLIVFLFFGSAVYAEEQQEVVSPESELYKIVRLMEDIEYEYTEDYGEKALLQDEYADKRLLEVEELLTSDNEEASEAILKDYSKHIQEVQQNLNEARRRGDVIGIESLVAQKFAKRTEHLTALLQREGLPLQAREGITKALANQENARQRFTDALLKAREAREQANLRAGEFGEQAERRMEEVREQIEERVRENREQTDPKAKETREQVEKQIREPRSTQNSSSSR